MKAKACFLATIAAFLFGATLAVDAAETTPSRNAGTITAGARQQIGKMCRVGRP